MNLGRHRRNSWTKQSGINRDFGLEDHVNNIFLLNQTITELVSLRWSGLMDNYLMICTGYQYCGNSDHGFRRPVNPSTTQPQSYVPAQQSYVRLGNLTYLICNVIIQLLLVLDR